jgi:hypothetical protein
VIDVGDMDALARIAEHYDRSILHEATADGDAFWVADESGQFRYALGAPAWSEDAPAWPVEDSPVAPSYEATEELVAPAWTDAAESEQRWAVPVDPDTFVQEGVDRRRTDENADASAMREPASAAYFTGLEWTANS